MEKISMAEWMLFEANDPIVAWFSNNNFHNISYCFERAGNGRHLSMIGWTMMLTDDKHSWGLPTKRPAEYPRKCWKVVKKTT